MKRRFTVVPLFVAVALGLVAGCSGSTGGSAQPTSSASGTAAIDPCSMLTAAEVSQYGLTPQGPDVGPGARTCSWLKHHDQNGDGYTLGVDVRDHQGIENAAAADETDTNDPIGTHPARQLQQTDGGSCIVAIGITPTSRVDIDANTDNSTQGCQLANQFAKIIEPKLPPATS